MRNFEFSYKFYLQTYDIYGLKLEVIGKETRLSVILPFVNGDLEGLCIALFNTLLERFTFLP